jgi:hypothetical protein
MISASSNLKPSGTTISLSSSSSRRRITATTTPSAHFGRLIHSQQVGIQLLPVGRDHARHVTVINRTEEVMTRMTRAYWPPIFTVTVRPSNARASSSELDIIDLR